MKKVRIIFGLAFSLIMLSTAISSRANELGYSVSVTQQIATVTGTVNSTQQPQVALKVYKDGIEPASATYKDLIYYDIKTADVTGRYTFDIALNELRGIFQLELICDEVSLQKSGTIVYDPTGDSSIRSFVLNDTAAKISGTTINVNLPAGTDLTGLIATFDIQKDANAFVGDVRQNSGYTRNNFTSDIFYTIVADDGTETTYQVVVTVAEKSGGSGGGSSGGGSTVKRIEADPVVVAPVLTPAAPVRIFNDVDDTFWAFAYIEELMEKKIVSGYEDGYFLPNGNIKREEFVKMLVNTFDLVPGNKKVVFQDISPDDWFFYYIDVAASAGVVSGISDERFGVGELISRQDMVTMLYRAAQHSKVSFAKKTDTKDITDAKEVAQYAHDAVQALHAAGIVSGYEDGSFQPNGFATRAQVCAVISKALSQIKR